MPVEHELQKVAKGLARSAADGAQKAAPHLLGAQGGPDAERVRRSDFVAYVRANWHDPLFRADLFARMVPSTPNPYATDPYGSDAEIPARNGLEHAEELLKELWPLGYPEPLPPMVAGAGGFEPVPY